ncbi:MAG TPA: hypothetical protein VF412_08760 [Bdellovibrio sp.]|uniref:hypothetical protein n=1 Tax=Bdellovibrio sp. TaxID=28201 RepID=UPI002F1091A5
MEMNTQGSGLEIDETMLSNESFQEGEDSPRSKTSLRMHYEAQVSVIRRQLGDLESVRLGLGLSQRKMSQLLMVDPSSWTRWTRQGDEAPPHIWRALQWFSALNDKIPGLTPHYFINQSPQVLHQKALQELDHERQDRLQEMALLRDKIDAVSMERDRLQRELQSDLQNELQNEVAKLKKDLNFHKKISIVVLSLSITWGALLLLWKLKT